MKLGQMGKKSDLDKLNELDKQNQSSASDKETKKGR